MQNETGALKRWGVADVHYSCFGMFLLVSFSTSLSLFFTGSAIPAENPIVSVSASTMRVFVFIGIALYSGTMKTLLNKSRLLVGASLVMTLSVGGIGCAMAFLQDSALFGATVVARFCANAGYAVLYLAWVELYSRMDLKHVLLYFTVAHLLSALFSFFLAQFSSPPLTLFALMVIPLATMGLLLSAIRKTKDAPYVQGEIQSSNWSIPWRPIILLSTFVFANTFIRLFLEAEHKSTVLLGVCFASLIVLLLILLRYAKMELKWLYQISVPLVVAGAMCAIVGAPSFEVLGAFCSNAAFALFSIFTTAIFCSMSYRYGINALWIFGFSQAALTVGSLAGNLTGYGFSDWLSDPGNLVIAMAILVVVLIALSMTLISDKDFTTTWGVTRQGENGEEGLCDSQEALIRRCSSIAQRYGLTRREEEILVLLSQGDTLSHIGEELFIADSTMKTHSRHIYRKLDVANKQELQEFVEAGMRR